MLGYLGFLTGQIFAVLFQWAHAKQEGQAWRAYWLNDGAARHVMDLVLSVVVFTAWLTGLLDWLAGTVGMADLAAKLPETPEGFPATMVVGFVLAFGVRVIKGRLRGREEPAAAPVPKS